MKKGFGLLEVLAAAVVLGFLLVGLNTLQLGNREAILRIRARDAASDIAQEVIDSIRGSASVAFGERNCEEGDEDLCRSRTFKNATVDYKIKVKIDTTAAQRSEIETTGYARNDNPDRVKVEYQFAKQIDVTVKWLHRNTPQSINVSAVVR